MSAGSMEVSTEDITALGLPRYTLGEQILGYWSYKIADLNFVLTRCGRLDEIQDVAYDQLPKKLGSLIDSIGLLEVCRQYYIELTYRLADMPLNSENITHAHRIINDLSEARSLIVVNMGFAEIDDIKAA